MKMIDVNTGWGFWPIQKLSFSTLADMAESLVAIGVQEAWLSAIESIAYPETETFDEKLAKQIQGHELFCYVKTVNPLFQNWKKELDLFEQTFGLPKALKVYPNFHDYPVDALKEVAAYALGKDLPLLIQIRMNDARNQPIFMQVADTSVADVAALSRSFPELRIVALCAVTGELRVLAEGSENLFVEPSFLDGHDPLLFASEFFDPKRMVFGSHAPIFYPMGSALKLMATDVENASAIGVRAGTWGT